MKKFENLRFSDGCWYEYIGGTIGIHTITIGEFKTKLLEAVENGKFTVFNFKTGEITGSNESHKTLKNDNTCVLNSWDLKNFLSQSKWHTVIVDGKHYRPSEYIRFMKDLLEKLYYKCLIWE